MRVSKVVRISDPKVMEKFQREMPECDMSVVHLVRDPRASINSVMVSQLLTSFLLQFPADRRDLI